MLKHKLILTIFTLLLLSAYASADLEFRDPNKVQFYTGIQMNEGNSVTGLPQSPPGSSAAVSQGYVLDNFVSSTGDSLDGDLNMNDSRIKNLPSPQADSDAATRGYVNSEVNSLTGAQNLSQVLEEGNISNQTIDMDGNRITGLQYTPENDKDAISQGYALDKFVRSNGDALGGNLDFNSSNRAINLADPENPQDAATKSYVENFAENNGRDNQTLSVDNNSADKNDEITINRGNSVTVDDYYETNTDAETKCGNSKVLTGNGCETRFTSSDDQYIGNSGSHTAGGNLDLNGNSITSSGGDMCIGKYC